MNNRTINKSKTSQKPVAYGCRKCGCVQQSKRADCEYCGSKRIIAFDLHE